MSRIGRTCSVPTDACAYHVPRVPCLRKISVKPVDVLGEMRERHRAILDERHRLAVAAHAHHDVEARLANLPQRLLRAASAICTTALAAGRGRPSARRDRRARATARLALVADELDQQDRCGSPISAASITGRNAGLPRARSIIVRSTSSTADGPSSTMCRAHSIARWSDGKLTTPSVRCGGSGRACSVNSRVQASVPSLPTSRCA